MRDLIISIVCMLVLILPWGFYSKYTSDSIEMYNDTIDEKLIPAIESGDWETAALEFEAISKKWDRHRKISAYFTSTEEINEIDGTLAKSYYYIEMQDESNSSGEVAYLKYKLNFLHKNESPNAANLL